MDEHDITVKGSIDYFQEQEAMELSLVGKTLVAILVLIYVPPLAISEKLTEKLEKKFAKKV